MSDKAQAQPPYLAIGAIVGVHGIRGEVKVSLMTDFPERFRRGAKVYLGSGNEVAPVEIEAARPHKDFMLVKFKSVPDRNAAELLREQMVLIPEAEAMPLGEHENYAHDLIGLAVETADGRILGRLVEMLFTKANDVYVVQGDAGEVLIPALRDVVRQVDLAAGKMVVMLPEGLLD
ncbi:MAG: ribosome maturation factor RimM [Chloroflexi bacterium]|nr:ribosome maturation factor RimM [Chloroflexota bacterium]